ncbi:cbb3-type cytochrome oxidase subunit 3 [Saccharospirillum alexandrii]|uniref:cbb3-type cytochrome oxidase subunit 3 n=1 Tax=Saccharospirillum alexandrii TaxID=2448477 RepID=UPI000FD88238|nr:cbb3-type cytochrome c oxidase subunit 3 [Saccharospirillum alexandrii]
MDINDFRGLATIFTMIAFFGIVIWAYSSKRKKTFDEAANLPFEDEALHEKTQARTGDDK